ncbi:MAG: hypothetical protein ABIQ40_02010 [Bacteroidia bacterium]
MQNTTPVPNAVFELVPLLSEAELKLYLIILRQTLGWRHHLHRKERKVSDWISASQFQSKTGLSRRAIVNAVRSLSYRNLILIADDHGKILHTPKDRRGKVRLYYRIAVDTPVDKPEDNETTCADFAPEIGKLCAALAQKMRITKETLTK